MEIERHWDACDPWVFWVNSENLPTWVSDRKLLVELFPEIVITDDLFEQPDIINENTSSGLQLMEACSIDELLNEIIDAHDAVEPPFQPTSELENN